MKHSTGAQVQDAGADPRINRKVRTTLPGSNEDSTPLSELSQPKPQDGVTGLHRKVPIDMSVDGATKSTHDGHTANLYELARPPLGARANLLALWRQHDSPTIGDMRPLSPFCCDT